MSLYLYTHLCIRNDEHCPNCRKYYVSICFDLNNALEKIPEKAKLNEFIWIDEWIRRRNGDKYQVIIPKLNVMYDISNDLDSKSLDEANKLDENVDVLVNDLTNNLINIYVIKLINENKRCPDNYIYKIGIFLDDKFNDYLNKLKVDLSFEDEDKGYKTIIKWEKIIRIKCLNDEVCLNELFE